MLHDVVQSFGQVHATMQPFSQACSPLSPFVVGIHVKTLVVAGHMNTCQKNFSTRVESINNFCQSLKRKKGDHWLLY